MVLYLLKALENRHTLDRRGERTPGDSRQETHDERLVVLSGYATIVVVAETGGTGAQHDQFLCSVICKRDLAHKPVSHPVPI
jgi:hypothetical protein